ncbi:MAG: HEAT repeat domain-containing protein [Planctomycetes bacterium]|nr:HEAT repeat domain-containing protein [Planctomycetota bacterium]
MHTLIRRAASLVPLVFAVVFLAGCGQKFDPDELTSAFLSQDARESERARKTILEVGDEMSDRLISVLRDETRRVHHQACADLFHDMLRTGVLRDFRANKVAGVLGDVLRDKATAVPTRHRLAQILGDFRVATAVRPLIAVLGTEDAQLERASTESLKKLGEIAVEPLVAVRDDPDTEEAKRASSVQALQHLGEGLASQLQDPESDQRVRAIQLLGQIGSETARARITVLAKDADARVRLAVMEVLRTKPTEAEREVLFSAGSDADESVALEAGCALAQGGDERARDLLVRAVSFRQAGSRVRAIQALGAFRGSGVTESLLPVLEDGDVKVRRAAADALETLADKGARAALLKAIEAADQDPRVRLVCARALGKMGSPEGIRKLISLLILKDTSVRASAIEALGEVGPPALDALLECLGQPPRARQEGACQALGKIGSALSVEALVRVVERPLATPGPGAGDTGRAPEELEVSEADVQVAAIKALAEIADERGVGPIAQRLAADDPRIRWYAQWALIQMGEKAEEILIDQLDNPALAGPSAQVLGVVGDERAVRGLTPLLQAPDLEVRLQAIQAIGRLAGQGVPVGEAKAALLRAAQEAPVGATADQSLRARKAALAALAAGGGPADVSTLVEWLAYETHPEVRFAATLAIGAILEGRGAGPGDAPSELDLLLRILEKEPALVAGLAQAEDKMQRQVVLRLGEMGHLKALPAIQRLLRQTPPGEPLHEAAALAYLRITGKKFEAEESKP